MRKRSGCWPTSRSGGSPWWAQASKFFPRSAGHLLAVNLRATRAAKAAQAGLVVRGRQCPVLVQQRDRRDRSLMAFEGAQDLAGVEIPQLRTSLYQEITDKFIADRNPLWRKRNLLDPARAAGRSPCVSDRITPG